MPDADNKQTPGVMEEQFLMGDPQLFCPGVWIAGSQLVDVPADDADYFKVRYVMEQAFDWKLPPPSKLVIIDVLFKPKPFKVFRPQRRRKWYVTWTEGGYEEIVPQELEMVVATGPSMPTAMPYERRHVPLTYMAWSGWQYELEQAPDGFPEFAQAKGWLGV